MPHLHYVKMFLVAEVSFCYLVYISRAQDLPYSMQQKFAGGDGGTGGNVILECSRSVWDFSNLQHHTVCF
jgi:hypothetical protein